MERRDVKILTEGEIRLVVNALGFVATLEHSLPEEIAAIRRIIRSLKEPAFPNKILSDIWLVHRNP